MCCETWPYVCTERDTCCLGTQVMVPLHLMKFLFNSTSCYILYECKPILFSVRQPMFLLDMIPFHYFSANSIYILFHHAAQYHRSRCLPKGSAKGGNLNLDGATWFLPRGSMGNLNISGVVKAWTGNKPLTEPNDDPVCWRIYATLGGDELKFTHVSERGRVSLAWVHRPCMAMWNPDANWKWGWWSTPFYMPLWRHMSIIMSKVIGNRTVSSTACSW